MNSLNDELRNKLQEFNTKVQQRDLVKDILNAKHPLSFSDLDEYIGANSPFNKILEDIVKTGDIQPYEWKIIKTFILYRLRETLFHMYEAYPDTRKTPGESFEDALDSIVTGFMIFEEKYSIF